MTRPLSLLHEDSNVLHIYIVSYYTVGITQHPRNDTFCTGSTALLSCTVYDNSTSNAANNTGWFRVDNPPVQVPSNINNTRNGDVVTSVLTIDNVSLSDNGTEYFCVPSFGIGSYIGAVLVAGMYMNMCSFVCTYIRTVCINVC